jgi:urea transport system substrate-binding protein
MSSAGRTVLVIDDDADLLDMVRFILERYGWVVVTAGNGREGIEKVAQQRPDLIMLDMKMPVMDGATFVAELHRRDASPPPIVVLTAADDARKRAADVGAADWLAKPFDLRDLVHAVEVRLGGHSRSAHAQ